jgi:hypothetical protein
VHKRESGRDLLPRTPKGEAGFALSTLPIANRDIFGRFQPGPCRSLCNALAGYANPRCFGSFLWFLHALSLLIKHHYLILYINYFSSMINQNHLAMVLSSFLDSANTGTMAMVLGALCAADRYRRHRRKLSM